MCQGPLLISAPSAVELLETVLGIGVCLDGTSAQVLTEAGSEGAYQSLLHTEQQYLPFHHLYDDLSDRSTKSLGSLKAGVPKLGYAYPWGYMTGC